MIKQQLDDDVKSAMLAGEALRVETLRGLKSAILYAEVAAKRREDGLNDDEILTLFSKEAKKRQDSAEMYVQGGSQERADKEMKEKAIIEAYLPAQVDEATVRVHVYAAISELGATSPQQMGQVIGAVKQKLGSTADGALIARLVKEGLREQAQS
jgi:uncharacterized protein YqeY